MSDDVLIEYAKKIATQQKYPRLESGLQPLESYELNGKMHLGLFAKLGNEMVEFFDALAHKTVWHVLHEVCDLYYYANQIEYQFYELYGSYINIWSMILTAIEDNLPQFVTSGTIRAMARAKYGYRAQKEGNKNEDYEISLMKKASSRRN